MIAVLVLLAAASGDTTLGARCDLNRAQIQDRQAFVEFFHQVQDAVSEGRARAVAELVHLPMRVMVKGRRTQVRSPADVEKNFKELVPDLVREAVRQERLEHLYCDRNGVSLAGGAIWIGPVAEGRSAPRLMIVGFKKFAER